MCCNSYKSILVMCLVFRLFLDINGLGYHQILVIRNGYPPFILVNQGSTKGVYGVYICQIRQFNLFYVLVVKNKNKKTKI